VSIALLKCDDDYVYDDVIANIFFSCEVHLKRVINQSDIYDGITRRLNIRNMH
jgi:hypothetical protein